MASFPLEDVQGVVIISAVVLVDRVVEVLLGVALEVVVEIVVVVATLLLLLFNIVGVVLFFVKVFCDVEHFWVDEFGVEAGGLLRGHHGELQLIRVRLALCLDHHLVVLFAYLHLLGRSVLLLWRLLLLLTFTGYPPVVGRHMMQDLLHSFFVVDYLTVEFAAFAQLVLASVAGDQGILLITLELQRLHHHEALAIIETAFVV